MKAYPLHVLQLSLYPYYPFISLRRIRFLYIYVSKFVNSIQYGSSLCS